MTVADTVTRIIVEQLGAEPADVHPDAAIVDDLGADSLDRVELVMALEEACGVEIPDEDAALIVRVRDAVDYLEARLAQRVGEK